MKPRISAALLLAACLLCLEMAAQAPARPSLLISNVNVVDVQRGRIRAGQQVLIEDGRIVRIGARIPQQADTVVDGRGSYLIPGLWDMHTHNWWELHFSNYYVANGVLGVRNMYTPMSLINPLKDSIQRGLLHGPKYVAAGRVVEGSKPEYPDWLVADSEDDIPAVLDTLQLEGSDFVKVYNKIQRPVYLELMQQARARGMRVEGHLPMQVSALEASRLGQRSFEHLLGIPDLCTRDTLFQARKRAGSLNWFAAVMREDDYGTMTIDEKLAARNFAVLRKNGTHVCPTLIVLYNYMYPATRFEDDPHVQKMPADITGFWSSAITPLRSRDSAAAAMAASKYETFKRVTYLLYKSGVPLLAGTDAMNPYCLPGFGLHTELKLLKDCGIPDRALLKMATADAAAFLGLGEYGRVEEGCHASLVLLSGNPLDDIGQLSAIQGVILDGAYLGRPQLDAMLK